MKRRKLFPSLAPSQQLLLLVSAVLLLSALSMGQPSITLSRTVGPPTTIVQVSGQGFASSTTIDIYFDKTVEAQVTSNTSGTFTKTIAIPASALPGSHYFSAVQQNTGTRSHKAFLVRTDWPQFGFTPSGTRNNIYENVLNPQNVKSLTLDWSRATQTVGDSALANGVLYTGSADTVWALNASTGATVWTYTSSDSPDFPAFSVGAGRVYVATDLDATLALNAQTGKSLWHSSDSAVAWNPPTLVNGMLYLEDDQAETIRALDAGTGNTLWTFFVGGGLVTACAPAVANGVVYASGNGLYALDANSGNQVWTFASNTSQQFYTPAAANGAVYVSAFDFGLQVSTSTFYALNATTGAELWSFKTGVANEAFGPPAVTKDTVYAATNGNAVYALNAQTGATRWKYQTKGPIDTSPAVANGVVYVTTRNGNTYALNAKTGELLWMYGGGMDSANNTSPVVANGVLYFVQGGIFYAFHLPGH